VASASPLIYEKAGAIARIRCNRPEVLNALDPAMTVRFVDACRTIAADPEIRVVVISGEGRAFMAGADLMKVRENPVPVVTEMIDYMHEALRLLGALRAPVLGSVHGAVAGGGLSLALSCDLLIAAEGTRFSFAYSRVAGSCDLSGSWNLVRQVGLRNALGFAMLGESVDAEQARQLGFVNKVVPAAELAEETEKLAQMLASGPTAAFGEIKKLFRGSLDRDFDAQLNTERESFLACTRTGDFLEALDAFAQKRTPRFEGK
jgi:2-(1,2-epoxy-1,2-dihydrophenyl)acetyl-CoA isomerase